MKKFNRKGSVMGVILNKNSIVYIACPANTASGGPELLHQLAYHFINDLNIKAFMYYYNYDSSKFESLLHSEYKFYKVPYLLEIQKKEDINENILIVPEDLKGLKILSKYKNIRKGIWLLSVDNYYYFRSRNFFFKRLVNKFLRLINVSPIFNISSERNLEILTNKYPYTDDELLKLANFYMTQSYRGMVWFKKLKPLYYLSDYLDLDFLKTKTDLSKKENVVAFNPKKGFEFTKKIIRSAKDIKFIPLINMSRTEVIKTFQKAKVYIDFGNHPGKDRMPREAAVLGCCVITGKGGSAAFYEDVPLPDEYKFEDKKENIFAIVEKIRDCFNNFKDRHKDFDYYREVIKREPQKFIEDMKKIFVKVE